MVIHVSRNGNDEQKFLCNSAISAHHPNPVCQRGIFYHQRQTCQMKTFSPHNDKFHARVSSLNLPKKSWKWCREALFPGKTRDCWQAILYLSIPRVWGRVGFPLARSIIIYSGKLPQSHSSLSIISTTNFVLLQPWVLLRSSRSPTWTISLSVDSNTQR